MSAIVSVAAFGSTATAIQLLLLRRLMQRRKRGWEYINSMGSSVPPGSSISPFLFVICWGLIRIALDDEIPNRRLPDGVLSKENAGGLPK